MRFLQKEPTKDDPDPKALSCYGLYLPELEETWLRFVDGRPLSAITTQFLGWCCHKLLGRGKKALLLIWDNASWHKSREVRGWITAHNRKVKENVASGVRIVTCFLPTKSPWLNAIEPKWVHGKRKVVEPERCLALTSLQIGYVRSLVVRITSIYPFPRRSPDRALGIGVYLGGVKVQFLSPDQARLDAFPHNPLEELSEHPEAEAIADSGET